MGTIAAANYEVRPFLPELRQSRLCAAITAPPRRDANMSDLLPMRSERPKLLITAVDGLVGANLACCLADRFEVLGISQRPAPNAPGWDRLLGPISETVTLRRTVNYFRPDWIIHCGPLSAGIWDLGEPVQAEREVQRTKCLAAAARQISARLTVILTDAMFCGPRLFHRTDDRPASRSPAAMTAARIERSLVASGALVVRTHAFGWSPPKAEPSFAERSWLALKEGRTLEYEPQQHASPILASDLAELLYEAYNRRLEGLQHMAGAERVGMGRFVRDLALALGLQGEIAPAAAPSQPSRGRLCETALDSRPAQLLLEHAMPLFWPGLLRFVAQASNGYRARLQAVAVRRAAA